MGLSAQAWQSAKWGLTFVMACILVYHGKLDSSVIIGLMAGAAMPVTAIMQSAGVVQSPPIPPVPPAA